MPEEKNLIEADNDVVIETKLIHKGALFGLVNNGGSISFRNHYIRIVYDGDNPERPFVELRLCAIPQGKIYKGNINPSLFKKLQKEEKKKMQDAVLKAPSNEDDITLG